MLRIDCNGGIIYVHRHLLCGRSEEMKDAVEESEIVIDSSLSEINEGSWHQHWLRKRGWELYIGFLYGHPIWTRSEQHTVEEDLRQLADIWDDGRYNNMDRDAADAASDAIRELVVQHSKALSRPFNVLEESGVCDFDYDQVAEFLVDFMVYGQSGRVFGKWYNAYVNEYGDGSLERRLGVRFLEKAVAKSERRDLPDLMERCKYHLNRDDPEQCYLLDK